MVSQVIRLFGDCIDEPRLFSKQRRRLDRNVSSCDQRTEFKGNEAYLSCAWTNRQLDGLE